MNSFTIISGLLATLLFSLVALYRRRRSLRHLRGPPSPFLFGNIHQFPYQENVGDLDFKWVDEYGTAMRVGGTFGEDLLMLADPKALQHIFHKSGYGYCKSTESQVMARILTGKGILWAHGETHQRHRKVMNPAFTAAQLRSFIPLFHKASTKLCQLWIDNVLAGHEKGVVLPVNKWLARLTLDVIGQSAFDFNFGALDDDYNEVSQAYNNMFVDSNLHPPAWNTIFRATWKYLPSFLLDFIDYIPTREYSRFRRTSKMISAVSKQLVDEKTEALLAGDVSAKDVMSVLVRANVSENPKTRLSPKEIVAQMSTLTLAGHETTASTLTWYLYELAKNPDFQDKLREEVLAVRSDVLARGDGGPTISDIESMKYMCAGMKETLRFHSIVYHLFRSAVKDDVIPLANPILTKSGETVSEIFVKAGQTIVVSICAYNRLTSVWGNDSDVWNPMRFIDTDTEKEVKIGTYSNLMSFSAGLRGCIGWRFSVLEMQTIMFDLIANFKFELPDENLEIRRVPTGIMGPMVKGKKKDGHIMPLRVIPL